MVKLFFLFSIQHSVRVSRKKLWKIGFSLPLCFPLEYRTIYWNFTRAKNLIIIEIYPLRSNKREATSILSSLQLKLEKYCFQLGFSLHFWAFVIHYGFSYRIVASRSTSRLVTCLGLFRLLMKGIFGPYVL